MNNSNTKRIVLAGGCFWGVQEYYKRLKGVLKTTVGYVNGNIKNPTYEDLKKMKATHAEACEIIFNPKEISLEKILLHMFRFIDPTSLNKQGHDVGIQYRTGVYYKTLEDKKIITDFIEKMQLKYDKKIVIQVEEEREYYLAEEYHQDYLTKDPNGYCHVNMGLILEDEKK
jgi:peptide-methionine (S)-S-oxide reductase